MSTYRFPPPSAPRRTLLLGAGALFVYLFGGNLIEAIRSTFSSGDLGSGLVTLGTVSLIALAVACLIGATAYIAGILLTVRISEAGIRNESTLWRLLPWADIERVESAQAHKIPGVNLITAHRQRPVFVRLDFEDRTAFAYAIERTAGPNHPLTRFLKG